MIVKIGASTKQEILEPGSGNSTIHIKNFEYSYHMNYYTYYEDGDTQKENYASSNCNSCTEKINVVENIVRLAYVTAILALGVAYMAHDSVKHLHQKNLMLKIPH